MNRKSFFALIERDYFTLQEGHNIATKEYIHFEIESTCLITLMLDEISRKDFFNFLVQEKEKDNWCFLSEEFASYFIQMLSTNQTVTGINSHILYQIEGFYYRLLQGLLEVSGAVTFSTNNAKAIYIAHMDDLRKLMLSIMDIEELKTQKNNR